LPSPPAPPLWACAADQAINVARIPNPSPLRTTQHPGLFPPSTPDLVFRPHRAGRSLHDGFAGYKPSPIEKRVERPRFGSLADASGRRRARVTSGWRASAARRRRRSDRAQSKAGQSLLPCFVDSVLANTLVCLVVTVGNMVGGVVLVAGVYWFVYLRHE
jgi:hypothetical protein